MNAINNAIQGMIDSMTEFIHGMLVDTILTQVGDMLNQVGVTITDSADRLTSTPMEFAGGGPWGLVESIAGTAGSAIQVVAGLILGFFISLELVQMLVEKNNLADIDMISVVMKWVVKSFIAITIVSNAFVIVGAVFQIGQEVIAGAALDSMSAIDTDIDLYALEASLQDVGIGTLIGLMMQIGMLQLIFRVIWIPIFFIIVGRFLEIFMYVAVAPIPLATMANQEYRAMGNNYLKSLLALAFQGLFMLIIIAVVGSMVADSIAVAVVDPAGTGLWGVLGYVLLMIFGLSKASAISKSVFGAH